jgi:hypothetical protein
VFAKLAWPAHDSVATTATDNTFRRLEFLDFFNLRISDRSEIQVQYDKLEPHLLPHRRATSNPENSGLTAEAQGTLRRPMNHKFRLFPASLRPPRPALNNPGFSRCYGGVIIRQLAGRGNTKIVMNVKKIQI